MHQRDINQRVPTHYEKNSLSFIVCGPVDNGKSTLLGRLLYDSGAVFKDQIQSLKKNGSDREIDYSYVLDGLQDERDQNITIDVAYRYFKTKHRNFILLDTPGHDQYVKNMAVAASQADVAIFVIDVVEGVTESAIRHANILYFMGVKRFILCVNKVDLIDYSQTVYLEKIKPIERLFSEIGGIDLYIVPVSAVNGDNVTSPSPKTPWYDGEPLISLMENIDVSTELEDKGFCIPIQVVLKDLARKFRGYGGVPASGVITVGEKVRVLPSGKVCEIHKIYEGFDEVDSSQAGISTVLEVKEKVDITRGDYITSLESSIKSSNQFVVKFLWFDETRPLLKSRQYLFKHNHSFVPGFFPKIKGSFDWKKKAFVSADEVPNNGMGRAMVHFNKPIPFAAFEKNTSLGSFLIVDRVSLETVGVAVIEHELNKAQNIEIHKSTVSSEDRALLKGQKPFVVWMTGLSGAGKSTVANRLEFLLHRQGYHTYLLDGDNVRTGLNVDLGFKDADRSENIRRLSEASKILMDAGLIVIVAAISPFRVDREVARSKIGDAFIEVFVDAPLEVCAQRDPKGLYKKQLEGKARNFTGIDSSYELPHNPELVLETGKKDLSAVVRELFSYLQGRNLVDRGNIDE